MKNIGGEIAKQDDRYMVIDNEGQEEVYLFLDGIGEMQLDNEIFPIKTGDVIPIKDGVFHKVYNRSADDLFFICIFDGARTK